VLIGSKQNTLVSGQYPLNRLADRPILAPISNTHSISLALSKHLGFNDILIGPWTSLYNYHIKPNLRFYLDLLRPITIVSLATQIKDRPHVIKTRKRFLIQLNKIHNKIYKEFFPGDPTHPPAEEIQAYDPRAWDQFFKFCFVRNPYERAVSDYLFLSRSRNLNISFYEFLKSIENQLEGGTIFKMAYDNWPMYTINGQIVVDFVGRYENLQNDLNHVFNVINLKWKCQNLLTLNKNIGYNYKDFYGLKEKYIVEKIFKNEIEFFEYEY